MHFTEITGVLTPPCHPLVALPPLSSGCISSPQPFLPALRPFLRPPPGRRVLPSSQAPTLFVSFDPPPCAILLCPLSAASAAGATLLAIDTATPLSRSSVSGGVGCELQGTPGLQTPPRPRSYSSRHVPRLAVSRFFGLQFLDGRRFRILSGPWIWRVWL